VSGFHRMPPETRRAISSKGGKAAWARGTAHKFTPEQAKVAGSIGGLASQRARKERAEGKHQ
jgi:uncharacterized protein